MSIDKENEKKLATTKSIIYLVTNLINGKVYVGQTSKTFYERYNAKGNGAERIKRAYETNKGMGNTHLYNALCKYGTENFKVEIVHIAKSEEELNYFEGFYERLYNSTNEMFGYNKKPCGDSQSGYHRSDNYYLKRIRIKYGKNKEESVKKFLARRKKNGEYNGDECYLLYSQKIEYLSIQYNGILSIPYKIVKTKSLEKLLKLNYVIIEQPNNKGKMSKLKEMNLMKKQARPVIEKYLQPFYVVIDYYGDGTPVLDIEDELWYDQVRDGALQILKNEFPELYSYLYEKNKPLFKDENELLDWIINRVFK